MNENYSVLMSVYDREKPAYLRQAMNSIREQTVATDDFVLVCDGPLNEGLEAVIREMQELFGDVLHVVRLKENMGLGKSLAVGLAQCRNDLVARMDSDDISYPDRCERQLRVFEKDPELAVISGVVEEFSQSPEIVDARRVLPETHEEIVEFAQKRNPFNHPCVMYRKHAVEEAGGYQAIGSFEDYYLWVRMLLKGMKGYNLQEPLLHMRAGDDFFKRRAGWQYTLNQQKLFRFMLDQGFISRGQYVKSLVIRSASALAPNWLRKRMFKLFLRR